MARGLVYSAAVFQSEQYSIFISIYKIKGNKERLRVEYVVKIPGSYDNIRFSDIIKMTMEESQLEALENQFEDLCA